MPYEHLTDCPPAEKQALPCRVFRIVATDPPTDSDFLSRAEEGKGTEPKNAVLACQWHGISIFSDIDDAYQHIDLFGSGPNIEMAKLDLNHGVVAPTPSKNFSNHMTWWPSDGIDRKSCFQCV